MSFLWKLIPAPYGVIVHYGLIVLLLGALLTFGYVKGIDHQQLADQAADDKARIAAQVKTQKRATAMRAISSQFTEVHANDQAAQPAALSSIADFIVHTGSLRQCPAGRPAGAGMPAVRPAAAAADAGAGADSGGTQALAGDIAHDASLYAGCQHELDALIDTAIAGGADKP